ncbi:MAG: hypothetical protein J6T10_04745 [Methanobrevibacter sp.]|nr:hypothetical protein [Methanobrevibacter sp.]
MEILRHEFSIHTFYKYTKSGGSDLEDYIRVYVKPGLIQSAGLEKMKENINYIIEFKREYWDEREKCDKMSIYKVIDSRVSFDGTLYTKQAFAKMVDEMRPFNMVLLLKTPEELNEETVRKNLVVTKG